MSAPDIRAQAIEALKAHQPHEDVYLYCTCGVQLADDGFPAHVVDALAEAGLLPTGIEWAVRFERQAGPTMDNPAGVITQTMRVRSEGAARQAVRNGAPISNAANRRVCSRPVGEWREVAE